MFQSFDDFLKKWLYRLKIFSFLIAIWAVFFSIFTILGLKAGFEYDDGLSFSTPAFKVAEKEMAASPDKDYWTLVNQAYKYERTKPVAYVTAWLLRIMGFKVAVICQREKAGADELVNSWRPLVSDFFFSSDDNATYELLENNAFTIYFASSDSGMIQAKKAGVFGVRLRKSAKSALTYEFSPGKFKEPILPLSEF